MHALERGRGAGFILVCAVLCLGFPPCLSRSPKEFCNATVRVSCKRLKKCNRSVFEQQFTSMDDCIESTKRFFDCSTFDQENVCGLGDYHGGKASSCISKFRSQECGDESTPEVCDEICEAR